MLEAIKKTLKQLKADRKHCEMGTEEYMRSVKAQIGSEPPVRPEESKSGETIDGRDQVETIDDTIHIYISKPVKKFMSCSDHLKHFPEMHVVVPFDEDYYVDEMKTFPFSRDIIKKSIVENKELHLFTPLSEDRLTHGRMIDAYEAGEKFQYFNGVEWTEWGSSLSHTIKTLTTELHNFAILK